MTHRLSIFAWCVIVTIGFVGAGCGGENAPDQRVAADLQTRVEAVRTAVVSGDAAGAEGLLNDLEVHVTELLDDDELDGRQAARILSTARAVEDQLASITTTTISPPPPAEGGNGEGGNGEGGNGEGGDRGGGDGEGGDGEGGNGGNGPDDGHGN